MKSKTSEKEWLYDFKDFMESKSSAVPNEVSQKVLDFVRHDLNPSAWLVFAKLFSIHAVIGTLSLSVCNQFGMNPFRTGFSLSEYFMKFGHGTCMVLCGFLFVSLSILIASVMLKNTELRVLKKNALLQVPSLSLLSLAIFMAFGADILFQIAFLWSLGAMIGGLAPLFLLRRIQL